MLFANNYCMQHGRLTSGLQRDWLDPTAHAAQVRLRLVDGSTRAAAWFGDADLQLAIPDAPARLYLPGLADEDGGDLVVRR